MSTPSGYTAQSFPIPYAPTNNKQAVGFIVKNWSGSPAAAYFKYLSVRPALCTNPGFTRFVPAGGSLTSTVPGLSVNTSYTFAVQAQNQAGWSLPSPVSPPAFIPMPTPTPFPIPVINLAQGKNSYFSNGQYYGTYAPSCGNDGVLQTQSE
jgi:hypothetical protein